MIKRPVDMERVRRSLARLDKLAETNPEAFDPERLPITAEAVGAAIARQNQAVSAPERRDDGAPKV